jgi:uncharacterized protein
MSHEVIRSPCIGVCDLDENGYCRGCRRTLDEVAGWISYTSVERDAIMADLCFRTDQRRRSERSTPPPPVAP